MVQTRIAQLVEEGDTAEANRLRATAAKPLFRNEMAPLYFHEGLGRATAPTAAFLGGQPGAGRTRLLHEVTAALTAHGPTVVIGGADLRPFHPADGRLPRTDPLEAAHAT